MPIALKDATTVSETIDTNTETTLENGPFGCVLEGPLLYFDNFLFILNAPV